MTLYQLGALHAFARAAGARVAHVKPHGALYNMAARDGALAQAIADAVHAFDPTVKLFGLAGSALLDAGRARGCRWCPRPSPIAATAPTARCSRGASRTR